MSFLKVYALLVQADVLNLSMEMDHAKASLPCVQ